MAVLGKSVPHDSAREHVTGEALYLDDWPPTRDEVLVDFVGSPLAHARIKAIDVTAALQIDGIVAAFTHEDVPGSNAFGPVFHDEELLAAEVCHYIGEPIVALAGTSTAALQAARAAVRLELEELPPVLTIEEAIAHKQFIGPTRRIQRGDVKAAFENAEHVLHGAFSSG